MDVGANTGLLKDLLGKIGGSCALFHQCSRRLRPRLLSTRSVLTDNGAAYRKPVGGCIVAVLRVAPDDRVARLEGVAASANRRGNTIDEQLPIGARSMVVCKGAIGIERRCNGIEYPTPRAVGIVVGLEAGLLKELLGKIGGSRTVLERVLRSGSPRLLFALGIDANDGACRRNLGAILAARAQNRDFCRYVLVGKLSVRGVAGIALGIASVLLARQARGNDNLRVVLRLRDLEILCGDNRAVARLKQTPILPGHRVIARKIHRNNTKGR